MPTLYTPKMVGERMDLPHQEVIRRIRRGDIAASKLGWNWVIEEKAVIAAEQSDWYKARQKRQAARSS